MPPRHPSFGRFGPRLWLMTDERMGDALWQAAERLPRGAGIVFRHYATDEAVRRAMFARLGRIARRRRLVLIRAGNTRLARHETGVHNQGHGSVSRPAHTRREAWQAKRAGAAMVFVSPVFATRSHVGARPLGPLRAATIGRGLGIAVIALGGMDARRFRRLRGLGFHGWAAIDAWR